MIKKIFVLAFNVVILIVSILVLILFLFMVWYAASHRLWPSGPWGMNEGNHGPWRGFFLSFFHAHHAPLYIVEQTLMRIFALQFILILLVGASLFLEYRSKRLYLLFLNMIYFCVLMGEYFWLID